MSAKPARGRSDARRWAALMASLVLGCGDPAAEPKPADPLDLPTPASESLSPTAQLETAEAMRLDLETPRAPSDGGGRAFLVAVSSFDGEPGAPPTEIAAPASLPAGSRARIDLVYEAGPLGVKVGGMVLLQVSPFWGWDTPQSDFADAPGYTEVATDASGVELEVATLADTLLGIQIGGRSLAAGERITFRYGAGPLGARVDRYAERESRIWFAVDGDGDGVRALVADSPAITIAAGPPARLHLTLPSTASPGEEVELRIALLDRLGNAGVDFQGELDLSSWPSLALAKSVSFDEKHAGVRVLKVRVPKAGVYRVEASARTPLEGLAATSNPIVVGNDSTRVLWADLHGHSNLSDGTGTPEDFMHYARDVAGLDVVALTDHDHWGMEFLDATPQHWERIRHATAAAHEPGRFVTLLGFEWTSWLHGHRHVLYFGDEGDVISSIDPKTETPDQLWAALAGKPALTFAHHSAGGPIATNWAFAPDPHFEPVTEIVSVHGSSEAVDSPGAIYSSVRGNFVRDALDKGYEFGFIGSGDGHDGHPGLSSIGEGTGGLAAILSEEKSRDAVLSALRARRVYATNGERIWLHVSVDGEAMGARLTGPRADTHEVVIEVVGTAAIEKVELIRGGGGGAARVESIPVDRKLEWSNRGKIPRLADGEYFYVRVVQENGGVAWSSPVRAKASAPD